MTSVCTPTVECYRPFTVGHIAKSHNLNPKAHEFVPQNSSSYHTVITIGHLNINHLRYKMEEIREIIIHHKLHILGVTETWLDQTVSDGEVEIQGQRMFRLDRKGKAGGGVCIYIHQSLSVRLLPISKSELEMLWIGIKFKHKTDECKIGCFYRLPNSPVELWNTLENELESLGRHEIIFMGDFNVDMLDKGDKNFTHMKNICLSLNLRNLISAPTRVTPTSAKALDLVLTNIDQRSIMDGKCDLVDFSDHALVSCSLKRNGVSNSLESTSHGSHHETLEQSWTRHWCCENGGSTG